MKSGWFAPPPAPAGGQRQLFRPLESGHGLASIGGVPYWFQHPNLQEKMLGRVFSERNYLVCSLDQMTEVALAMGQLLNASLRIVHLNQAGKIPWDGAGSVRDRVRWEQVQRFYGRDELLYANLSSTCMRHFQDAFVGFPRGVLQ
eukprot:7391953-Prymnesium_polylepis.5